MKTKNSLQRKSWQLKTRRTRNINHEKNILMDSQVTVRTIFYVEGFPDLKVGTPVTITIPPNAGPRFAVEIDLPVDWINRPNSPQVVQAFSPSPRSLPLLESSSSSLSLSPGDDPFRSRELTPNSDRTSVGLGDSKFDLGQVTPGRSPLMYPPSVGFITDERSPAKFGSSLSVSRQPTLLQAMKEQQSREVSPIVEQNYRSPQSPRFTPRRSVGSPQFSPSYNSSPTSYDGYYTTTASNSPYSLASSDYSSPYLPSPEVMSGYQPDYRGNTIEYGNSVPSSTYRPSPCLSPYVGGQTYRPTAAELDVIRRNSPEPY